AIGSAGATCPLTGTVPIKKRAISLSSLGVSNSHDWLQDGLWPMLRRQRRVPRSIQVSKKAAVAVIQTQTQHSQDRARMSRLYHQQQAALYRHKLKESATRQDRG